MRRNPSAAIGGQSLVAPLGWQTAVPALGSVTLVGFFVSIDSGDASVARKSLEWRFLPSPEGRVPAHFVDPKTGSWILIDGTWFVPERGDDFGSALLETLDERGVEGIAKRIEGSFVIVGFDGRSGTLEVATDPTSSLYVFCADCAGRRFLSTSSLLLAAISGGDFDVAGLQEFLHLGVLYGGRTLHRSVRRLWAGTVYTFRASGEALEKRWWSPSRIPIGCINDEEAVELLSERLLAAADAVRSRHPKIAADVTGGRDSRTVVSALIRRQVPFTGVVCGEPSSPDVRTAFELAEAAGFPQLHLEPENAPTLDDLLSAVDLTDGAYDCVEYSRIAWIHASLAARFDISLNGAYGEIARGHWWTPRTLLPVPQDLFSFALRKFLTEPFVPFDFGSPSTLDLPRHIAGECARINADLVDAPNARKLDNLYLMMRLQNWRGRISSSTQRIWPTLPIFSTRAVLEAALSIPPVHRFASRLTPRLVESLSPVLARVPFEDGLPGAPITRKNAMQVANAMVVRPFVDRVLRRGRTPPDRRLRVRDDLLRSPEVREVVDPATMRLRDYVAKPDLQRLIPGSAAGSLPVGQWNRVLTLELMLRRLGELRRTIGLPANRAAPAMPGT